MIARIFGAIEQVIASLLGLAAAIRGLTFQVEKARDGLEQFGTNGLSSVGYDVVPGGGSKSADQTLDLPGANGTHKRTKAKA